MSAVTGPSSVLDDDVQVVMVLGDHGPTGCSQARAIQAEKSTVAGTESIEENDW